MAREHLDAADIPVAWRAFPAPAKGALRIGYPEPGPARSGHSPPERASN